MGVRIAIILAAFLAASCYRNECRELVCAKQFEDKIVSIGTDECDYEEAVLGLFGVEMNGQLEYCDANTCVVCQ